MQNSIIPVIIPCRNEIDNLNNLFSLFLKLPKHFIPILVDNASTDGSGEYARKFKWDVISQPNIGYGNACQKGIEYIFRKYLNVRYIGFFDADISEDPRDLEKLSQIQKKLNVDLILGSRKNYFDRMPSKVRVANIFFALLIRLFYRYPLYDNGPMRIIKTDLLKEIKMKDKYYGWTFEMTMKSLKLKKNVVEIPIRYFGRFSGESKISGNIFNSVLSISQIFYLFTKYLP